jgi:Holliday junction resolvase
MVRTGYQRGRANEYRAMEQLRKDGWVVLRSAGSHSPLDLFAARNGERLLVQVKSGEGHMSDEQTKELIRWAKEFDGSAEVWHYMGREGVEKKVVHRAETKVRP